MKVRRGRTHDVTAFLTAALVCILVTAPAAKTLRVSTTPATPFTSIQAAIDASSSGDTILVASGRYFEDVDFVGKGLVLKSESGPETTIIDASNEDSSAVIFRSRESTGAVLDGFTITGGRGTGPFGNRLGGGIYCPNGSPRVRHNIISDNHANWGGGMFVGIYDTREPLPTPVLEENAFLRNSADNGGGGLIVHSSQSVIRGNRFCDNTSLFDGGGLTLHINKGANIVENNVFLHNVAGDQGGGVLAFGERYFGAGAFTISGNLFARNEAHNLDLDDLGSGGGLCADMRGTITQNTFVLNTGIGTVGCGGGGIRLLETRADLTISGNIIALNEGCGVNCRYAAAATFGPNLFWANTDGDFSQSPETCPSAWQSMALLADPKFCDVEKDSFSVAEDSPALTGETQMGAFAAPGCHDVPVIPVTWGRVKAIYRSER